MSIPSTQPDPAVMAILESGRAGHRFRRRIAWLAVLRAPGWRRFWYSRSSNTARERLKPLVLTLARLLEMTSSWTCCDSRPVLAVHSDLII